MILDNLKEPDKIKISLYNELLKQLNNDQFIVPEVFLGKAIADLLVVNGDIHIYEIKSKNDSLSRLEHQLIRYKQCANKVTLVVDQKFITKLDNLPIMDNVGIILVDEKYRLKNIQPSISSEIEKQSYFAYWSPIELRETLRGFPGWYKLSSYDACLKLEETLTKDEVRRLTLFRLREKYIKEFIKRVELIKSKKYADALKKRFDENMNSLNITPLKNIPYSVFRDFGR
ncbi:sce7726 family protein [Aliarcobacter skirrowii]|uniref:sce7726 family protein n=1 Tax=Aliarcobacter skirrowii TaxID=28200 RepID=UPI00082B9482|nr:sce7726 family protein [Aliarcobacter skirrowii]